MAVTLDADPTNGINGTKHRHILNVQIVQNSANDSMMSVKMRDWSIKVLAMPEQSRKGLKEDSKMNGRKTSKSNKKVSPDLATDLYIHGLKENKKQCRAQYVDEKVDDRPDTSLGPAYRRRRCVPFIIVVVIAYEVARVFNITGRPQVLGTISSPR